MVICIIALPVFAILGLFSLRYRMLTAEAFRCLFKTVAFKPCDGGLDIRIKSKFTAKLMWWPAFARFFYRYFTLLSWIFVVLMLVSAAFTGLGVYNYIRYGNCNGPDSSAFCIFNVVHPEQAACSTLGVKGEMHPEKVVIEGYPSRGVDNAEVTIVEYGCYSCPYTREAEPVVQKLLNNYPNVKLVYHDVPLLIHPYSVEAGKAAICADEQGQYWDYHDLLFDVSRNLTNSSFIEIAQALRLNETQFLTCLNSNNTRAEIDKSYSEAMEVGIYGTPTFFINNKSYVGPQEYSKLKEIIETELKG
jgi:protein-disulfide isomerase